MVCIAGYCLDVSFNYCDSRVNMFFYNLYIVFMVLDKNTFKSLYPMFKPTVDAFRINANGNTYVRTA